MSVIERKTTAMRQICNLGIDVEVNLCYLLLDDHHKTPETLPVCFKWSFVSYITINLFLKASFSSIYPRGETKACQCKCFCLFVWWRFFSLFYFLISPPFSPFLPIKCHLLLLPAWSFFLQIFVVPMGGASVSHSEHGPCISVASFPCLLQEW